MLGKAHASQRVRCRHDGAAVLAGAKIQRLVEILVGSRDRIGSVIVDGICFFMQKVIAACAIPVEPIDFARYPGGLNNELKGVRRKARRMRNKWRLEQA